MTLGRAPRRSAAAAAGALVLLAGCVAGPDYVRPAVEMPAGVEARGAVARPARPTTPRPRVRGGSASATPGSTRCSAQALAQSPTLALAERAPGAGARGRPRRLGGGSCRRSASPRARPRQQHLRQPAAHQLQQRRTSRRCRTTSCRCSSSATSSTSPAACGAASKARRRAPSSRPPTSRTSGCCSTADLATAYFNLRATDIELDVLARSIALQRRALDFVQRAPRARRLLRPRGGAAAGPARHHADPGRPAAPPARPVRARGRDADRHAGAGVRAGARHRRARAADGAARRALRRAAAPARRRLGRAGDGGGQRADRRRHAPRSIRASRSARASASRARSLDQPVRGVERALVVRRDGDAAALQRRPAEAPTSTSRGPATTRRSPTTGASS